MDAMESFDTTMAYLADPARMGFLPPDEEYFQSASAGMDLHDQISNLDDQSFISADDFGFAASDGLAHPALKRFASSYDEFFPPVKTPNFEATAPEQAVITEDTALDRENKLLGFSMPVYHFTLLDYSLRRTSLNMSAHLHGMFFLAESQWPADPEAPPPPPELTCYRRNLFQITGSITVPRTLRYIMTDQGDRIPILAQELVVSATESVEGNAVKIISVPWKTPAGGAPATPEDKAEREPPPISLDTMASSDVDTDYAVFPIQWKRLQFRIATANNGRRKELQQHFLLSLKILATLSTGTRVCIAEAQSGAIIVRGRSPRNFQSRKDLPLSTSASISRKHMGAGISRSSAGDSIPQTSRPKTAEFTDEVPQAVFQQYEQQDLASSTAPSSHWSQMPQQNTHDPLHISDYKYPFTSPELPQYPKVEPTDLTPMMPLTSHKLSVLNDAMSLSFSSDEERSSPIPQRPRLSRPNAPTSNPSQYTQLLKDPPSRFTFPATGSSLPTPDETPQRRRPRLTSPSFVRHNSDNISSGTGMSSSRQRATSTNPLNFTANIRPLPIAHQQHAGHFNNNSSILLPTDGSATTAATVGADQNNDNNNDDGDDSRYEYFPLSLDEWLPPVDGVLYGPPHHHHRPQYRYQYGTRHSNNAADDDPSDPNTSTNSTWTPKAVPDPIPDPNPDPDLTSKQRTKQRMQSGLAMDMDAGKGLSTTTTPRESDSNDAGNMDHHNNTSPGNNKNSGRKRNSAHLYC